jgi:hypothetical protein
VHLQEQAPQVADVAAPAVAAVDVEPERRWVSGDRDWLINVVQPRGRYTVFFQPVRNRDFLDRVVPVIAAPCDAHNRGRIREMKQGVFTQPHQARIRRVNSGVDGCLLEHGSRKARAEWAVRDVRFNQLCTRPR